MSSTNTDIDLTKLTKFYSDKIKKQYDTINHLESEISKRDERIAELETELKQKTEQLNFLEELLKSKLAEPPKPSEPFIFTKDIKYKTNCGDPEILWEDEEFLYGRVLIIDKWYPCNWVKKNGHADNMTSEFNLIPILPEKRVVDAWVVDSLEMETEIYDTQGKAEKRLKELSILNPHIEHHQIELKGQSNV